MLYAQQQKANTVEDAYDDIHQDHSFDVVKIGMYGLAQNAVELVLVFNGGDQLQELNKYLAVVQKQCSINGS